jgi:hypothetical protein
LVPERVTRRAENDDPSEPLDDSATVCDDPLVGWAGLLGRQ